MLALGYIVVAFCSLADRIECSRNDICGDRHLLREKGTISSPLYPLPYPPEVECTWTILIPPNTRLTIFILDFDVHDDGDCPTPSCCNVNHLSLPTNDNEEMLNFCGPHKPKGPIHLKKNQTIIKFKSTGKNLKSRGFNLTYIIVPILERGLVCSDELGCSRKRFQDECDLRGKVACDSTGSFCFDNATQRCNGVRDCLSGIDEYGCPNVNCEHRCRSFGCYTTEQRCDGNGDCRDLTDELGCDCEDSTCSGRICVGAKKLCSNAKCLHPSLWCDGNDDCGDNSDEDNCIRNSVISATIMGCLFCGLMLVIAVMCALRIYSIRHEAANYRLALPQHIATRLSMTNSISLPAMDDEFFHREPPPAYSVACGQGDLNMTGILEVEPGMRRSRTRRHRTRPLIKPPTPPPSSETSNQSSPSRDSITSSSYLSNDDSAHLIGT
ncbi:hypothetical protein GE061_001612 [Apolygus lucorum]|uniref:Uncharacterized protein n=1 Tax=Apolygus lucorum TaxID=248454 RepID=A0A6A4KFP0_APOLU|nr:hypothetical protein GE061_001612 [Apolygus lucorum]